MPLSSAGREKLRRRTMSQKILRDFSCMVELFILAKSAARSFREDASLSGGRVGCGTESHSTGYENRCPALEVRENAVIILQNWRRGGDLAAESVARRG